MYGIMKHFDSGVVHVVTLQLLASVLCLFGLSEAHCLINEAGLPSFLL